MPCMKFGLFFMFALPLLGMPLACLALIEPPERRTLWISMAMSAVATIATWILWNVFRTQHYLVYAHVVLIGVWIATSFWLRSVTWMLGPIAYGCLALFVALTQILIFGEPRSEFAFHYLPMPLSMAIGAMFI
jgi:hypothetical protein